MLVLVETREDDKVRLAAGSLPEPLAALLRRVYGGVNATSLDDALNVRAFGLIHQLTAEEFANRACNLASMRLERKMAGVEKVNLGIGIITRKRLRAGGQEERVVLAPHSERRRAPRPEELLELRVKRDVTGVVKEEVKLDIVVPRPRQQRGVKRVGLRRQPRVVGHSMPILEFSRIGRKEGAKCRAIGVGRILPIFLNRIPTVAQPLLVGVAILRNDSGGAFGMFERNAETNRRAVIENIYREAAQERSYA